MLVTFKTAKIAKEKGFDLDCNNYYQDSHRAGVFKINSINNQMINELRQKDKYCVIFYSAPTQSELQKWLREEHNIDVWASKIGTTSEKQYYFQIMNKNSWTNTENSNSTRYLKFEEALEEGLFEALKLVPNEITVDSIFGEEKMKKVEDFVQKHKEEALHDYGWCKGNVILPEEEPKQETLEEVIEQELENHFFSNISESKQAEYFIRFGINWQKERSFSEEDLKLFARQFYREIKLDKSNLLWDDLADKCLEKFKKK